MCLYHGYLLVDNHGLYLANKNLKVFENRFFYNYSSTRDILNSHIEQSLNLNSNIERAAKRIQSKISKPSPRFDDFVPLQQIKAQYKGHRNARY